MIGFAARVSRPSQFGLGQKVPGEYKIVSPEKPLTTAAECASFDGKYFEGGTLCCAEPTTKGGRWFCRRVIPKTRTVPAPQPDATTAPTPPAPSGGGQAAPPTEPTILGMSLPMAGLLAAGIVGVALLFRGRQSSPAPAPMVVMSGPTPAALPAVAASEGDLSDGITPTRAKKMIADKLAELGLPYTKLTAKTIDFTDLARSRRVFVTVHGWVAHPAADDLKQFAVENGFRVDFRGAGFVSERAAKNIEDETPIMPWLVAESAIERTPIINEALSLEEIRAYGERLSDQANAIYKANPSFRKKIKASGNKGRDQLYVYMQHWFAAMLKKERPDLFKQLPSGYGWSEVYW